MVISKLWGKIYIFMKVEISESTPHFDPYYHITRGTRQEMRLFQASHAADFWLEENL